MDAAVGDEPLQSDPGDLTPDRVVTRDHHRFGRIVDYDIDAGCRLDRADVASLAADDAPFHLVGRKRHDGNGPFGDKLPGHSLDCDGQDALSAPIGLLARLLLDQADVLGRLVASLSHDFIYYGALGFLARQPSHGFQFVARLGQQCLILALLVTQGLFERAQTLLAAVEVGFAPFKTFDSFFEYLLARLNLAFQGRQFAAPLTGFVVRLRAGLHRHVLGLDLRLLDQNFPLGSRFRENNVGFGVGRLVLWSL